MSVKEIYSHLISFGDLGGKISQIFHLATDRKECILADAKKWVNNAYSASMKRNMQAAQKGLESALGQLKAPPSSTTETTASVSDAAASYKTDSAATDGKAVANADTPETAAKRREMEAAAAKGDYVTAGRIQAQLSSSAKVDSLIASRRKEMDDAAAKKDYVEAGRLQVIVQYLESNRMRLNGELVFFFTLTLFGSFSHKFIIFLPFNRSGVAYVRVCIEA